jgi:hypothetical protein
VLLFHISVDCWHMEQDIFLFEILMDNLLGAQISQTSTQLPTVVRSTEM